MVETTNTLVLKDKSLVVLKNTHVLFYPNTESGWKKPRNGLFVKLKLTPDQAKVVFTTVENFLH